MFIKLTIIPSQEIENKNPRVWYLEEYNILSFGESANPEYGNSFVDVRKGNSWGVLETTEEIRKQINDLHNPENL